MKTRTIISLAALGLGGAWALRKWNRLQSTANLLKIESPRISDLNLFGQNLQFKLEFPIVNPETQSFSGSVISVRIYQEDEEIAYSEPGIIPFSVGAGARTIVHNIVMNVPTSSIDKILDASAAQKLTYHALIEVEGIRTEFTGPLL